MIRVIRPNPIKRVKCGYCGVILSYNANEDLEDEYDVEDSWAAEDGYYYLIRRRYILCPECGEYTLVEESAEKRYCE